MDKGGRKYNAEAEPFSIMTRSTHRRPMTRHRFLALLGGAVAGTVALGYLKEPVYNARNVHEKPGETFSSADFSTTRNVHEKPGETFSSADFSTLQDALAAAAGKTLVISPGTYNTTSTLRVADNTTIRAYGAKIQDTSTHRTLLSCGNGVTIEGLELEGAGNAPMDYNGKCIAWEGASAANRNIGLTLKDVYMHDVSGYGLWMRFGRRVRLTQCRVERAGYAAFMALSVDDGRMNRCTVDTVSPGNDVNAYGIAITKDSGPNLTLYPRSEDWVVDTCRVENVTIWEAFDTHVGRNIAFVNCTARGCARGFVFTREAGYAPQHCKVEACTVYGLADGSGQEGIHCVGVGREGNPTELAEGCKLIGNTLYNCGKAGNAYTAAIAADNTLDLEVSNNTIIQPYVSAINLAQNNQAHRIVGNTIVDVRDDTRTAQGVYYQDGYNSGRVSGNIFKRRDTDLAENVANVAIAISSKNNDISVGPNPSNFVTYRSNPDE